MNDVERKLVEARARRAAEWFELDSDGEFRLMARRTDI